MEARTRRLENIEALRACAVLFVLLYHYTARFPLDYVRFTEPTLTVHYGDLGVRLFFIISGYCIYMTATHTVNLRQFWLRRVSRLQPAYMAAILVTFLTVSYFGLPGRSVELWQAVMNVFWLNGLRLVPSVDGVYWSLVVECKLYLLFGIIFFATGLKRDPVWWWSLFCLAGALIWFIDSQLTHGVIGMMTLRFGTFVFPHSAFFLAGMLIYKWDETAFGTKFLAITAYLLACCTFPPVACLILMALFPICKMVLDYKPLRMPVPVVYLGAISYSLYLVHQNVGIVVLRETAAFVSSPYGRIGLAIVISVLIAALIHACIEHRFREPFEGLIGKAVDFLAVRLGITGSSQPSSDVILPIQPQPEAH